jgi:type VI secretion system protein ImpH
MDDLIRIIEREYYTFDVLQLVAVLGELSEAGDRDGLPRNTGEPWLRFEADADMSFPPGDVGCVRIDTGKEPVHGGAVSFGGASVRLPFMNLLGSASPLPAAFSDYIARGRPDADLYAGFLSIMQNRLHALWVDACQKYALWGNGGAVAKKIFESMTGLPVDSAGFFENALAGLWPLSNKSRSAQGLKELLRTALGNIPINIEENIGRWAAVSNVRPLGAARLGRNAAAGAAAYDKTSKFRVTVGPLSRETYSSLMPGKYGYRLIAGLLSIYMDEPIICELEITCRRADLPKAQLRGTARDGGNEIGRTAVLGTICGSGLGSYLKTLTTT